MHYTEIKKTDVTAKAANMSDYDTTYADFSWNDARKLIDGLPEGKFNIAHEAIERHVNAGHGAQIALRWVAKNGDRTDFSYGELSKLSNRFANVLRSRGLEKGARVYSLLGRTPELYVAALGTLKAGCIFCPLFSAFGPEPIQSRMEIGGANALVTSSRLYNRKIKALRDTLPELNTVLLTDGKIDDCESLAALMNAVSDDFRTERMELEDKALLHFTSGTTGSRKVSSMYMKPLSRIT